MKMTMRNENYKLTEKDFLLACIKMNHYWLNRQEILQKAKERYSKEKAAILFTKQRSYKRKVKRTL